MARQDTAQYCGGAVRTALRLLLPHRRGWFGHLKIFLQRSGYVKEFPQIALLMLFLDILNPRHNAIAVGFCNRSCNYDIGRCAWPSLLCTAHNQSRHSLFSKLNSFIKLNVDFCKGRDMFFETARSYPWIFRIYDRITARPNRE